MKLLVIFLGTWCLVSQVQSQGFVQSVDLNQHNPYRRQLTSQQQSHILSDIQQHQHRFSGHNPQQSQSQFLVQQQSSVEIPLNPTQHTATNQRLPPIPQATSNSVRFPQNNQQAVQHHTQTGFIPNFAQQSQSQRENFQYQRSLQNQLQQPFQTQPQLQPQPNKFNNAYDPEFHAQNFLTVRNQFVQVPQHQSQPNQFVQPQQFQSNPQFTSPNQFSSSSQFHSAPHFQQSAQLQQKQPFPTGPQYQFPPNSQNFQTAPQLSPAPQFQPVTQFQTAPQFTPQFSSSSLDPEKQKLIQKHEQFVQKQYEKQQNKVKQLHDEFLQKQEELKSFGTTAGGNLVPLQFGQNTQSRGLLPGETHLFNNAVQKFYDENPTTTSKSSEQAGRLKNKDIDDQFERLLQAQRKDIYAQLNLESEKPKSSKGTKQKSKQNKGGLGRDDLLKQLKLALADSPQSSLGNKTFDMMDLVLPNGQTVQVIRTNDPNLLSGQNPLSGDLASALGGKSSPDPSAAGRASADKDKKKKTDEFPEALKSVAPSRSKDLVLPNGQRVEIVRSPDPGAAAGAVSQLPPDLASLYSQSLTSEARVVSADGGPPSIEELAAKGLIPEGFEIVGAPGAGSKGPAAPPPPPPPPKKPTYVYLEEQADGSFKVQGVKANGENEAQTSGAEVDSILHRIKNGDIQLPPTVKKVQLPSQNDPLAKQSTAATAPVSVSASTSAASTVSRSVSTQAAPKPTTATPQVTFPSSTVSPYSTLSPSASTASTIRLTAASSTYQASSTPTVAPYTPSPISSTHAPVTERLIATTPFQQGSELTQILKSNGLYAMAKYLRQSGLDSILNETGPYTVFAPTDKAFKNLLIQLGGPERAEEKFKTNPRLLSGLLLHHVIPGSFEISALQDEMTGVSLAGTQLRVNQYSMHDQEWNDVMVTTINGAMVVGDKQDIKIPQGVAHGVDRVMFPLPVGDLLQTLQSDRERRFTTFLKVLYASGMSELLQNKGTKTYTVFAPTDKAFAELEPDDLEKLTTDKDAAQAFAMRHVMPGTLFSAGMRFYQIKDSLLPGKTITLQKTSAGKIKVNDSQMITSNIPSTNGVIHALDGLL